MARTIRWLVQHQELGAVPGKTVTLVDDGLAQTYVDAEMAVFVEVPKKDRQLKSKDSVNK